MQEAPMLVRASGLFLLPLAGRALLVNIRSIGFRNCKRQPRTVLTPSDHFGFTDDAAFPQIECAGGAEDIHGLFR
jgi:hypothetical protein